MRKTVKVLALASLSLALPATASAATGATTIDLDGRAFQSLRGQGVTVAAGRPARIARRSLRLPVRQGVVGATAYLNHGGTLRLRKGRRSLTIERLQTRLGRTAHVAGTIKGRRLTILAAAGTPSLDAVTGAASLRDAPLTIARGAARTVKRALKLERLPKGRFGRATIDALVTGSGSAPGGGGDGGGGGGPGDGPPQSPPISDEPPLLARPATAVDVSGATVTWHVRDSWIRYASTEHDVAPLGGAVPGPAIPQDQHACPDVPASAAPPPLVYSYALPFLRGWHDPASGRTALYTAGGARFLYPSHGIDLEAKDLEIELDGAASRVIARFDGRGSTNPGNKRAVLVTLAASAPAPAGPPATVRGSIPSGGSQSVFAGFYRPGDGFGCVTVSYTL